MLTAAERWGGGDGERPFLPRAFSVLRAGAGELQFLIEDVGPGTRRLCELEPGERLLLVGPLGNGFAPPREGRAPLLVGGGVGIAPLAIWQDELGGQADHAARVPRRGARPRRGAARQTPTVATDDGSVGHHGLVTELLEDELDDRGDEVEVYACGPPAMLEAVRAICTDRSVPAQLALESGMACGFGACFGCVVPTNDGYVRLCVDGPVLDAAMLETRARGRSRALTVEFCGIELAHPIINASGTFDAIAAHRAFGDELLERFPFAAFVSKTVTVAPRQGNPPPRLWEVAGGLINSIGLPNKGLSGYLEHDLPFLADLPVPLIVNVMGFSRDEVAELVEAFAERPEVAALELNVSCPNVETGLIMGADPDETARLIHRVRPLTGKPLIVKLTPNASDAPAVAKAAQDAGADARVADQHRAGHGAATRRRASLGSAGSPAARPVRRSARSRSRRSTRSRRRSRSRSSGMGGVQSGRDALDLMRAGAHSRRRRHREFPRSRRRVIRVTSELSELLANTAV